MDSLRSHNASVQHFNQAEGWTRPIAVTSAAAFGIIDPAMSQEFLVDFRAATSRYFHNQLMTDYFAD